MGRMIFFEPPTSSVSEFEEGPSDAALRHIKEVTERQAAEDRAELHDQALAAGSDLDIDALLRANQHDAAGQLARERLLSAFSAADAHKTEVYERYLAQLGLRLDAPVGKAD